MSWITENTCKLLTDLIGATINLFGSLINNVFFMIVEFAQDNQYVINANKFTVAAALSMVALLVVKQVLSGYILETDYDSEANPFNLIVRIAVTVAVISCSGWVFNYLLDTAKIVAKDLVLSTNLTVGGEFQRLLRIEASQLPGMWICYVLMLLIMLIAFIIFSVVSAIRGCELVAMKIFMPFFALDLLTTNRERWTNFFTGYLIAFFSYAVQILFFTISLKSFASFSYENPMYMYISGGFLILAIKAPKFLEKYMYTSGVSKTASGGMRMVAQVAMLKAV